MCSKHSTVIRIFPLSPISNNSNNSVIFFVFCGISMVGGWWFLCIVPLTASLGNWESQTADEMSPHELPSRSHTLTNSHANGTYLHSQACSFSSFYTHTLNCKDLSSNACQAQWRTSLPNQAAASHMHTVAFQ